MDLDFAKHFMEEHWKMVSAAIVCLLGFFIWRWLASKKADHEQEKKNDHEMRCNHGVRKWVPCRRCAREFEAEVKAEYKTNHKYTIALNGGMNTQKGSLYTFNVVGNGGKVYLQYERPDKES